MIAFPFTNTHLKSAFDGVDELFFSGFELYQLLKRAYDKSMEKKSIKIILTHFITSCHLRLKASFTQKSDHATVIIQSKQQHLRRARTIICRDMFSLSLSKEERNSVI